VSSEYAGIFPRDKQQLKKLPGVGEYTARAILAFGYGEPLLAWDTNLETIFSRYYH
jgi:A/G-specific adenine glycosylase